MANNRENPFGSYFSFFGSKVLKNYWAGRKLLVHQRRGIASSGVQRKMISLLIEGYVARERFHRIKLTEVIMIVG